MFGFFTCCQATITCVKDSVQHMVENYINNINIILEYIISNRNFFYIKIISIQFVDILDHGQ